MDKELVKLAFKLGYQQGCQDLEKQAFNPLALLKPLGGLVSRGGNFASRTGRFLARQPEEYARLGGKAWARGVAGRAKDFGLNRLARAKQMGGRYVELLRGGNKAVLGEGLDKLQATHTVSPELAKELNAVFAARAGTAAAGAAGTAAAGTALARRLFGSKGPAEDETAG